VRLGDYIDDYCTRCKRSTDHSIAAMVGEEVQKVACRICHTEHPYRHNDSGKPTKEQVFEKLVANAKEQIEGAPAAAGSPATATPAKTKRTRK
jgi:hypothetical protein